MLKRNLMLVLFLILPTIANAENFSIGTGGQSGIYYPFGGALAKVWSEHVPDVNVTAEVTAASVENTIKVVRGDMIAGIAMGNVVLKANAGAKPFPKKMPISVLFALYPNVVQFIVKADSKIMKLSDLKGKKVSLGAPGSGTRVSSVSILNSLGITEKDIQTQSLNYTATTRALANSQIDAGVIVGSLSTGALTEVALTHKIRILSFTKEEIAKITAVNPSYETLDVPAGNYNNVPAFTAPAVWNVLVVNKDLDEKLAYQMTKTAFENIDQIRKSINDTKFTTIKNMIKLKGAPLHKGALKYRNEQLNSK